MKAYKVSAQKSIIEIRARFTANRSSEIDQVNNEILALYRPCLHAIDLAGAYIKTNRAMLDLIAHRPINPRPWSRI